MERPTKVEYDDKDGLNLSPSKDESLRDFKSPTTEPVARTSSKVKIVPINDGKKAGKDWRLIEDTVANSGRVRERWARKFKSQPTIESALLKSAKKRNKGGHTCPLCMKYFADVTAGTAHSKKCATKNSVPTKKLLEAHELQERLGKERVAIGLPAGPYVPPSQFYPVQQDKIPRKNRTPVLTTDPDLQLGLALSKSLREKELECEFEEAYLLAGQHCGDEPVVEITESQRRQTLENFGFTTDKLEPPRATFESGRWRRKKNLGPTILETRTQESRERLMSDKIAESLMGNESITQVSEQSPTDRVDRSKESRRILESRPLKEIHRTTERVWDSAQLSAEITNFYVEDLRPVLVPIADCQQEKSLNSRTEQRGFGTEGKDDDSAGGSNAKTLGPDGKDEISKTSQDPHDPNKSLEKPRNIHVTDRQYRNSLIADWSNTLNDSSMSDVVVLVKNNHIWAHKLVFSVRCSQILVNCESNDDRRFPNVREKIVWLDIEYLTAITFLEFVYTGEIERNSHAFDDNRVIAKVRRLARTYRIDSLFGYLDIRKKKTEMNYRKEAEFEKITLCPPIVIDNRAMETDNQNIEENKKTHNYIDVRRDDEFPRERFTPIEIDCDEIQVEENELRNIENQTENGKNCQDETEENSVMKGDTSDLSSRSIHGGKVVGSFMEKSNVSSEKIVDNDAAEIISISSSRSTTPDLFDDTNQVLRNWHADRNCEKRTEEEAELSGEENLNILAQLIAEDVPIEENSQKFSTSPSGNVTAQSPLQKIESERVEAHSSRRSETLRSPKTNADTRQIDESSGSQNLAIKPKSNISLFIATVQRINARSALESYSEDDTLGMTGDRQRFKNPFNVNNISNESLGKFDQPKILKCAKQRDEDDAQIVSENCDESFVNEISRFTQKNQNESSFNDETIDPDDENVSMYSKYKRNNEKNNSIVTYRNLLTDKTGIAAKEKKDNKKETFSNEISLKETFDTDFDLSTSFSFDTHTAKNIKSDNNDSRHSSMLPKLDDKVNHVNDDSIVSEKGIKGSRGTKSPSTFHERVNEETNNMTNSFELLDEFEVVDGTFIEKSSHSSKKSSLDSPKNSPRNNEISKERTKEYVISNSGNDKIMKHAAEKSSQQAKSSKTLKKDNNDYESNEMNDVIFSKSLKNSKQLPQSQTKKETSQNSNTNCDIKSGESLSRAKSPSTSTQREGFKEIPKYDSLVDKSLTTTKSIKICYKLSEYKCFDENDEIFTQCLKSPDISPHGKSTPLTSGKNPRSSSPILISSESEMDYEGYPVNEPDFNKENTSKNERNNLASFSPLNYDLSLSPQPGTSRHVFSPSRDCDSSNSARKLLSRSISMPTSTSDCRDTRKETNTSNKKSRRSVSQKISPPSNYESMDTPELKIELDKFGIKKQSRKRARQLLYHINDRINDDESPTTLKSDVDESSENKKSRKNYSDSIDFDQDMSLSQESVKSQVSVIAEETVYPDSVDVSPNKIVNSTSIKQAFKKLLKVDKKMYHKVLTYEPLSLERLHLRLKEQGLKCKLNALMDLLDEENITFKVLQSGKNRTKGKGKNIFEDKDKS